MDDWYGSRHPVCDDALSLWVRGELPDVDLVYICSMVRSDLIEWVVSLLPLAS